MDKKYINFIKRLNKGDEFYSKYSPYMSEKDFDYLCFTLKVDGVQRENINGADVRDDYVMWIEDRQKFESSLERLGLCFQNK